LARALSESDRSEIGASRYVLERYGYGPGPRTRPSLVLTFDGGPDRKHTAKLLDILRDQGVRASFFVTGQGRCGSPTSSAAAREGHSIGNRTLTYPNLDAAPSLRARQELVVAQRALRALTARTRGSSACRTSRTTTTAWRSVGGVLAAQRQGYPVLAYDTDVQDLLQPSRQCRPAAAARSWMVAT
jgi:peptidoglycan/xylan/chitin deacetylase (PgdA/CDA1 family)